MSEQGFSRLDAFLTYSGNGLTWSNLQKNRTVKQKPQVLVVMIETYEILTGKYGIMTAPSLVLGLFLSSERSQFEITKK